MSREEVVALMESSASEDEWNRNCDKVQAAFDNDYPEFWYAAIVLSGLLSLTQSRWA